MSRVLPIRLTEKEWDLIQKGLIRYAFTEWDLSQDNPSYFKAIGSGTKMKTLRCQEMHRAETIIEVVREAIRMQDKVDKGKMWVSYRVSHNGVGCLKCVGWATPTPGKYFLGFVHKKPGETEDQVRQRAQDKFCLCLRPSKCRCKASYILEAVL